jgi:hypothetical protein
MQAHAHGHPGPGQEGLLHGQGAFNGLHRTLKDTQRAIPVKLDDLSLVVAVFGL